MARHWHDLRIHSLKSICHGWSVVRVSLVTVQGRTPVVFEGQGERMLVNGESPPSLTLDDSVTKSQTMCFLGTWLSMAQLSEGHKPSNANSQVLHGPSHGPWESTFVRCLPV